MGYKPLKTDAPQAVGLSEPKMQYPSLYIDRKVPQEIMDKDVGEMCRLEVVGKIKSKSIDSTSDGEEKQRVEIEIHKMGYIGKAGKVTRDEYLSKNDEEREEYDKKEVEENHLDNHKEEEE